MKQLQLLDTVQHASHMYGTCYGPSGSSTHCTIMRDQKISQMFSGKKAVKSAASLPHSCSSSSWYAMHASGLLIRLLLHCPQQCHQCSWLWRAGWLSKPVRCSWLHRCRRLPRLPFCLRLRPSWYWELGHDMSCVTATHKPKFADCDNGKLCQKFENSTVLTSNLMGTRWHR